MTKQQLVIALAERAGITKSSAELVVNGVFDSMSEALARGEGVEIRGFGSFVVRSYQPYAGRNPKTGEKIEVPAKRAPFFKVGKELKAVVLTSRHIPLESEENEGTETGPEEL